MVNRFEIFGHKMNNLAESNTLSQSLTLVNLKIAPGDKAVHVEPPVSDCLPLFCRASLRMRMERNTSTRSQSSLRCLRFPRGS